MNQFEKDSQRHDAGMNPNFIQVGIVKDNRDPHNMGRLKVWLVGSSSAEANKNSWVTCSYSTPFGGRTQGSPNANSYEDYPKSYGFWAVPPDVGTRVFVFFVNGNIESGYWFGCAYDHLMNHQVPGPHTKVMGESELNTQYPVTDFDRNTPRADPEAQYPNVPLVDSLQRQNLLYDPVYGTPDRSARRQSPGTMYGMSTPRGNHIVLDDGYTNDELNAPKWDEDENDIQNTEYNNPTSDTTQGTRVNEGIVLRTRSGAQIMVSETEGTVFVINRDGTSRIFMDKDGNVSITADQDISLRAKQDINFYAERNMNVEVLGDINTKVHGNTKTEILGNRDLLLVGNDTTNITEGSKHLTLDAGALSLKVKSTTNIESEGKIGVKTDDVLNMKSANTTSIHSSDLKVTASKTSLSGSLAVGSSGSIGGGLQVGSSVKAGSDVTTPKVSLNNHNHIYSKSKVGPTPTTPASGGGSGSSPDSPDAATEAAAVEKVEVPAFEPVVYQDVVDVNPDTKVNEKILADIDSTGERTLSGLCWVMPFDGQITKDGYWSSELRNGGWTVSTSENSSAYAIADGFVADVSQNHIVINHRNGYISIMRDLESTKFEKGKEITQGTVIGTTSKFVLFEIRRVGSSLFGFEGSTDPGLFYIEKTGTGQDAANKSLSGNTASNEIAKTAKPVAGSSDVVKLIEINSILSKLPTSGYLQIPIGKAIVEPVTQKRKNSTIDLPQDKPIKKESEPVAIEWVVTEKDTDLIDEVKINEGSKQYQERIGYFKNNRFQVYRDSLGFPTIGYGHLLKRGENFSTGLTEQQADLLLEQDLRKAVLEAKSIANQYQMVIPRKAQKVLVEMVFQLGKGGTLAFKKMLRALANNDYRTAAAEMKDSRWYNQTPNRVQKHIDVFNSL